MGYVKVSDMRCKIREVMTYINKFNFFFGCVFGEQPLRHSDVLSKALWTESLSVAQGQRMAIRQDENSGVS